MYIRDLQEDDFEIALKVSSTFNFAVVTFNIQKAWKASTYAS